MHSSLKDPATCQWSAENQAALEHLLAQDLRGQVAVFDADDTLWQQDVGEGFLRWLQAKGHLLSQPEADVFARYEALCAQDKWIGYPYATQVMAGLAEADVRRWAQAYFQDHFATQVYAAQRELMQGLQAAGATPWIVSASNQWIVEAGAPYLGIAPAQAVGIRLELEAGRLTEQVIEPMTYRSGKVAAIETYIGQAPVLVMGDSLGDYEMLCTATQLALVINPKDQGAADENIFQLARQHGWAIQVW